MNVKLTLGSKCETHLRWVLQLRSTNTTTRADGSLLASGSPNFWAKILFVSKKIFQLIPQTKLFWKINLIKICRTVRSVIRKIIAQNKKLGVRPRKFCRRCRRWDEVNFKVGGLCWRWVGLSEDRWVQRVVWSCRAFLECRRLVEVGSGFWG